jgi:5'(3')-deoxyribonucleotidase
MFKFNKKEEKVTQISRKFVLRKEIKLKDLSFRSVNNPVFDKFDDRFKKTILYHIDEIRTYSNFKEVIFIRYTSENFEEINKLFDHLNANNVIFDSKKFNLLLPSINTILNRSKPILYIDMDGVIANFDAAIKAICPDLDTSDGDLIDYLDREKKVDEIVEQNRDIFYNLPPYDDAIEAVTKLFELYDVYFLSTPMYNIPESYSGKRVWLEKYFGDIAKKRLILTHRKDLVKGDFLVDDRIRNGVENFGGVHLHFGTEDFPNWKVTFEYLKEQCQ